MFKYAFSIFFFYRSEENVSVLSKQIEDMREFERQAADKKLKGFQMENVTLKSK